MEIPLVLGILVVAMVLFATEWLRVDLTALLVLTALAVFGLVSIDEAFSGFANPAVVTVVAMYVLGASLSQTGVTQTIGHQIYRIAGDRESLLVVAIMLTVGTMSAFMNNIGATAVLFPAVVGLARQAGIPASKLLMPLAFGSLLGGMLTLIGTPPNLLVSMSLEAHGFDGFEVFDFVPVGLPILIVGVLFMATLGRRLLPVRVSPEAELGEFIRTYLTELMILPESPLIGRTLAESRLGRDFDIAVLGIIRKAPVPEGTPYEGPGERPTTRQIRILSPLPHEVLNEGDHLLVEANVEKIMEVRRTGGVQIKAELGGRESAITSDDIGLLEVVISPQSWIVGRTMKEIDFRNRFQVTALGIYRHGEMLHDKLGRIPVKAGDVLLVQGQRESLRHLRDERHFLVLEEVELEGMRTDRAWRAMLVMGAAVGCATFGLLHIALAGTIAAIAMVLLRCLTMEEAYRSIDWKSVFLIAGMLPLAIAMEHSGAAQWLAGGMLSTLAPMGPLVVMGGFFIATTLLTQVMSNAAAAVLVVPIALEAASGMGLSPYPFAMAIAISASTSFITPVAHPANILVYGPGNYRFLDYMRVGGPLLILIFFLTLVLVPMVWPLVPGS
ncbi:MAG: SLC13 family permease [Nitrospirota bacterium]|nr:SLC13 family permease [Nitrospirota bacterium]